MGESVRKSQERLSGDRCARAARLHFPQKRSRSLTRISGLTPRIQDEIVKRSDGNFDVIDDLVEEAHEGVFDVRRCGGCDMTSSS